MLATAETYQLPNKVETALEKLKKALHDTWVFSESKDIYLPVITRHMRWAYEDSKIQRYNEMPWGGGVGISRYDEKGNWNGLYVMAFKDSFNQWEPIAGYGWEKIWRPIESKDFRLGAGFTLGVTVRESWQYIPVAAPLPLLSIGYDFATFQMTYIPGTYNNGNVYFAWLRFQI